jgi:hypothetical protein
MSKCTVFRINNNLFVESRHKYTLICYIVVLLSACGSASRMNETFCPTSRNSFGRAQRDISELSIFTLIITFEFDNFVVFFDISVNFFDFDISGLEFVWFCDGQCCLHGSRVEEASTEIQNEIGPGWWSRS